MAQAKKTAKSKRKSPARSKVSPDDIVQMILEDHKPLKKLIQVLKDSENEISERREAFAEFAPLLVRHAKPEEMVLYTYMKGDEEMREEGFEGDVEHQIADQMVEEAKRTKDEDLWTARVKVLAELVEHHIEEEENDLLPEFKKHTEAEDRAELGRQFRVAKENMTSTGEEKNPDLQPEAHTQH